MELVKADVGEEDNLGEGRQRIECDLAIANLRDDLYTTILCDLTSVNQYVIQSCSEDSNVHFQLKFKSV